MTWETLEQLIGAMGLGVPLDPRDPGSARQQIEAAAERSPTDRALALAVRALHDCSTATAGLDPQIGGVHLERIVSWNAWDSTWVGTHADSGSEAVIRVLRARSDDPVSRRALMRDARALEPLVDLHKGPTWAWAFLPGDALPDQPTTVPEALARLASTALAALARFEATGQWPVASRVQWRTTPSGVAIVALESRAPEDAGPALAELARGLAPDRTPDNPIEEALHALALAPPRSAAGAVDVIERALATDLAARRHTLFARHRSSARAGRVARLLDAVHRMEQTLPPPQGRGAIGVDLEGNTLAVECRSAGLWWGPPDGMTPLWSRSEGFDAPEARKLLRVRASAPPNAGLQREVGGSAEATAAIGRWVAAGLRLRTVRMLLEKELS